MASTIIDDIDNFWYKFWPSLGIFIGEWKIGNQILQY
jgi:hypothetical protein